MREKLRIGLALLALIGMAGMFESARGQEVTAAITGTVVDQSAAPIKGATVTARDTARGTIWTAETNADGVFNMLRLPVGTYTVSATAPGFDTASYAPFTLVLNQTARLQFQMSVG